MSSLAYAEPPKKFKSKKYKQYQTKVYKKKLKVSKKFYSPNSSYAIYDYSSSQFDNEHNVTDIKSIASITKLFTAITVVNSKADLNEKQRRQSYQRLVDQSNRSFKSNGY
jgi:D-alanyl-D-alanine carboxypeptidase